MEKVKFTSAEIADRVKTERIIIDSLMRIRDKEIDKTVKEFIKNNEEYLIPEEGVDIRHVEPLIEQVNAIYNSYDKYKRKLSYVTEQYNDIKRKELKEMQERLEQENKKIRDIFKSPF